MQDQIRGNLTGLMLSTPPVVRAQLSEALAVISRHDFPARWPSLLPDLIHKLQQGGRGVLHGVLETANSIFKRYRDQYMSPALSRELELCEHFVQPLLDALTSVVQQLGAAEQGDGAAVRQLLLTARLALRIFFSMNSPGLTPVRPAGSAAWRPCWGCLGRACMAAASAAACCAYAGDRRLQWPASYLHALLEPHLQTPPKGLPGTSQMYRSDQSCCRVVVQAFE